MKRSIAHLALFSPTIVLFFAVYTANAGMDVKHTRDSLGRAQQQQQALWQQAQRGEASQTPQFSSQKKETSEQLSSAQVANLYNIQNDALAGFFKALDKIAKVPTNKEAYLYLKEVPEELQKIHMHALDRARFEVDWLIPHKLRLTNNDFYDYIRLKGYFPASVWSISAAFSFPWNSRAYDGLEVLEKLRPKRSSLELAGLKSIPVLAEEDSELYQDPNTVDWFNTYTAQQLLGWVQREVAGLFKKGTVATDYRLDQLIKQSKTDDDALRKLYVLAFLNPEDRIRMLEHFMYPAGLDWALGMLSILRRGPESIQRSLPLKQTAELYLKVRFLPETREFLKKEFPDMSPQSIDTWIDTYLLHDEYTNPDDIKRAIQEQEREEASEAEASTFLEQLFAKTSALTRPLFFWL